MAVALLLLARPASLPLLAGGTALVLLGVLIRIWAAGLLRKGQGLCVDGPYRFVRHPLYLGSTLGALGFCVMAHSVWAWAVLLPAFLLVYLWQVREEERLLAEIYAADHAVWVQQVPMLVPRVRPAAVASPRPWTRTQALSNREHYHVLVTLLFLALFYLKDLVFLR